MTGLHEYTETDFFSTVLAYLPFRISSSVKAFCKNNGIVADEIKLRINGKAVIRYRDKSFRINETVTSDDIDAVIRAITGNSLYSYTDTLKQGYITTLDGIRVGVCGNAVVSDSTITNIYDISSVSIRIPHRHWGMAHTLCGLWKKHKGLCIVYSPPMGGKTSILREFTAEMTSDNECRQIAVVDTKKEISAGLDRGRVDLLYGYPRDEGINIAVSTLSPDIIVCDEIISEKDIDAILSACGGGVSVVASVHGTSADIMKKKIIKRLTDSGFVSFLYGIEKNNSEPQITLF